jgi:hypothetical protein
MRADRGLAQHFCQPDVLFFPDLTMSIPHLPALRKGKPYDSLEKNEVKDHKTGEVKAEVSQVNAGIVRKDLARIGEARAPLKKFTVAELIEISAKAGELFLNGTLPLGDRGHTQSRRNTSRPCRAPVGLPHIMVKRNMAKLHFALTNMKMILNGLSRGLDMSVIDNGLGEQAGCPVSYFPTTQCLGLVMPSNSPAVNSCGCRPSR